MTRKPGMTSTLRLRPEVSWTRDPGQPGFLFAAHDGGVYALNRTGAAIVDGIVAGHDRAALVVDLMEGFETDEIEAGAAVDAFLAALREHDLVAD